MADDRDRLLSAGYIVSNAAEPYNTQIQNSTNDNAKSGCRACCPTSCFRSTTSASRRIHPPAHSNGDDDEEEDAQYSCCCFSACCRRSPTALAVPGSEEKFTVYKRRWYILGVFSLMAFTQAWGWNTWGPIATSSKCAFGWTTGSIAVLGAWGPTMFLLSVMGYSYIMQKKSLRWACVITATCLITGAGVRCISVTPPLVTYLMNLGQVGYSLAGPVSIAGASVLSMNWFPQSQRFTATAIMSRMMAFGGTSTFIWGPRLVLDPTDLNTTVTNCTEVVDEIRADIHLYMYVQLGVAAVMFLAVLLYFPGQPPTPPTLSSASIQGVTFKTGLKQIMKHKQFWLLCIPYGVSYGVYVGWSANLDIVLEPFKITQITVGWLAFVGNMFGAVVSLVMARFIDRMAGYTKPVVLIMYTGAAAGFLTFALVCFFYDDSNTSSYAIYLLYVSRTLGAGCVSGLPPIVFEVLCETTYPIPATVTNGVTTFVKNIAVLVFLVVLMVPGIGSAWMNWFMVASATICIPMVLIFKGENNRMNLDKRQKRVNINEPIDVSRGTDESRATLVNQEIT